MTRFRLMLCGLALLLAACGQTARVLDEPTAGANPPPVVGPASDSTQGDNAPALPALGLPQPPLLDLPAPRLPSVSATFTLSGDQTYDRSALALPSGGSLTLPAGPLEWAMYQFSGIVPADQPNTVTVRLDDAALPQQLWVGITTKAGKRWAWWQVDVPTAEFSLPVSISPLPYTLAGNLYVAVLTLDNAATIDSVSLSLRHRAPPPVELEAGDGTSQAGIALSWVDPAYTYSDEPDFDYDEVAIERAQDPAGPWVEVARVPAGVTEYLDESAADFVNFPLGQRFHYHLRTVRVGLMGNPGTAQTGYVDIRPQVITLPNYMNLSAPSYLDFDATGCSDPDGGPLIYEWSIDNGESWVSSGYNPDYEVTLYKGTYVWLRVRDDEGSLSYETASTCQMGGEVRFWKASIDGTTNNGMYASAADPQGNLLVAYAQGIFAKFDSAGDLLWKRRWSPATWEMTVAEDGSFYAATESAVGRFSPNGDFLWGYSIDLESNYESIALPSDRFNELSLIYYEDSSGSDGKYNWRVVKFDPTGAIEIDRQINTAATDENLAGWVAVVDEAGDVVVNCTHISQPPMSVYSPLVLKLNQAGHIEWQKHLNGTGFDHSIARGAVWSEYTDTFVGFTDAGDQSQLYTLDSDGTLLQSRAFQPATMPRKVFEVGGALMWGGAGNLSLFSLWDFEGTTSSFSGNSTVGPVGFGSASQWIWVVGIYDPLGSWSETDFVSFASSPVVSDAALTASDPQVQWEPFVFTELESPYVVESTDGRAIGRHY
jgi:hypothetical protein